MIKTGIYKDLSNEDYHKDPAISRSGVMDFLESPYKYWSNRLTDKKPIKEETEAMAFGTAFHTLMLEPEKFVDNYIVEPERVFLKYDGKEAYEAYKKLLEDIKASNRKIISLEISEQLMEMRNSLLMHAEARQLIEDATYEESYFWEDEHTGIMLKARPDIIHDNMIVDLKTCKSADTRTYQRSMVDGGYHIQGAMCLEAIRQLSDKNINTVINICVEKEYPYQVGIKIIGASALEIGHAKFKQALLDIKACADTNMWPSYEAELVELPSWAI